MAYGDKKRRSKPSNQQLQAIDELEVCPEIQYQPDLQTAPGGADMPVVERIESPRASRNPALYTATQNPI